MPVRTTDQLVSAHYGRADLAASILSALRAAGKNLDTLSVDDLAPLDQFHTGGKEATLELARFAELTPGTRVLDVGGGVGGPARVIAQECGCSVEVLDITEEYCHAGEMLTALTKLGGRVSFRHGSALQMPYGDGSYDVVWTQHSTMNIAQKEQLYKEIKRVLRRGGRLAMHEITAGGADDIRYPVPWARERSISFLQSPQELRTLLKGLGFSEVAWSDETASTLAWFERRLAAAPVGAAQIGLHLLLGNDFLEMSRNLARNLKEGHVRVVKGLYQTP